MDKLIKLLDEITKKAFEKRIQYDNDVDSPEFNYWKGYHEAIGDVKKILKDSKDDYIIFERNKNPKETKLCSDCIHYEKHYEEVVAFGEYETLTKSECNKGHDIRFEDNNYATDCEDYYSRCREEMQ